MEILGGLLAKENGVDFREIEQNLWIDGFLLGIVALELTGEFIVFHDKKLEFFVASSTLIDEFFSQSSFWYPIFDFFDLGQLLTAEFN